MIDAILKLNGAKFYEIYKYEAIKNPVTGSKGKSYIYDGQIYAFIQPTGSRGNVKGITLESTSNSGDKKIADFFMFSKIQPEEKKRVFYRGLYYEIRSVEPWENKYLKFYKSYLVKVDNQNV